MLCSERILKAALNTTHRGLVFIRNATLTRDIDPKCLNELAEALHELPAMVQQVQNFRGGEAQLIELIRTHLGCFDSSKWPGSPNLVVIFEDELSRAQQSIVGGDRERWVDTRRGRGDTVRARSA